jgi:transcriptional regulator with XRE-family HTH domain
MSIYQFNSYTDALLEAVSLKKQVDPKWTMAQLAEASGMQPSYVTNVLKGRGDFNSEQLFRVCERLDLDLEMTDFLTLLLELKKTTYPKRKTLLEKKLQLFECATCVPKKIYRSKTSNFQRNN